MGVYDLEEQEKLDDLKAWWKQWGGTISVAVILACVAIIGVQGWRLWTQHEAEQASALYSAVSSAMRANDLPKAKDATAQLTDHYSRTAYAPAAAMMLAKMLWESGDKAAAKAQLQWVIDKSGEDEMKQVARFRLAEMALDAKAYDEALQTLDAKHDEPFAGLYADLRGDILAAAGRAGEARTSYQTAIAKLDPKSAYRNYVQVKLDALGGPISEGPAVSGGAGSSAAPAAAPAPTPAPAAPPAPAKSK
jgi:predicted negative regulator of RcsB-dependent stress response